MKRLVPALIPPRKPTFDPLEECPEDISQLVDVAKAAGYELRPADAAEIWRRSSSSVWAIWLSPRDWSNDEVLNQMMSHGVIVETAETPRKRLEPPQGYSSWLDYAVDCMDTRSVELERVFDKGKDSGGPNHTEMRLAVQAELEELRQRAGVRRTHRLSDLMAEMPEGLPRAEDWDKKQAE